MVLANRFQVLVDTGPLVAFVRATEASHQWATARFKELPTPFFTCEPVLAETFFLLSRQSDGSGLFFDLLASGLIEIDFSLAAEHRQLAKLVHKYRDLPMSLADSCLVRMAENRPDSVILTLDADFRVYRKHGRQAISVIMPQVA